MLAPVDGFARRLESIALGRPEPGSRCEIDGVVGFEGATYAAQNVSMGLDHLRTWQWLLECGRAPQFAHMTLMRAAFEGAATALWLLGSDASAERVRRAAIFGLEDLRNRRTFEAQVEARAQADAAASGETRSPHDWGTARSGSQRYHDRRSAMTAVGIEKTDIPTYTALMEDFGPGAHVYQLTSAFAHRREWAMAFADELARLDDTGMPGSGAIQLRPSADWALKITDSSMTELGAALDALEAHLRNET
jgi:hypothetical protein